MIGPRLLGARPVVSARRKQRPSVLVASWRAIQPICASLQLSCPETKSAIHPFFSYETFISFDFLPPNAVISEKRRLGLGFRSTAIRNVSTVNHPV
jgi:hypothetical protein